MKPAIHQFLPSFAGRDAIGRHTLEAQRILREAGFDSDIYCGEALREVAKQAKRYQKFEGGPAGHTWLLYQLSTGSPVADFCVARPEPLIVDYHNITPAEFFEPWEPHVAVELIEGRHQLADLAGDTSFAMADSSFNESELIDLGYRPTAVAPILLDLSDFDQPPDQAALDRLRAERDRRGGGAEWLFVGRIAPNKCQHDVLKAFAAYVRLFDPRARLHLVGGSSSHRYETAMREFVEDAGIGANVNFASSVSHGALLAYYAHADVFVCLSEHEGFCVPLLEALHHGVPIVAFESSAVPETLGGAGLCLKDKSPIGVAEAVRRVVTDDALRAVMVEAGRAQLQHFSLERTSKQFLDAVESFVGGKV
ncbi:MAG: glycosyltransferase family 4 protein [Acidimicrobiia bacterium]